jgi:hypothetical protein
MAEVVALALGDLVVARPCAIHPVHRDDAAAVVENGDHHVPLVAGRLFLGGGKQLLGVVQRERQLGSHLLFSVAGIVHAAENKRQGARNSVPRDGIGGAPCGAPPACARLSPE